MRRLLTPRWLLVHALVLVLVVGMLGLAGWQAGRAASGNTLSWGYLFQWPVFAGFVVFIWAREVRRVVRDTGADPPSGERPHDQPAGRRPVVTRRVAAIDDTGAGDDPQLAAYNRYLAWLNAHPEARAVDYPG
jgi:hypothetical protein